MKRRNNNNKRNRSRNCIRKEYDITDAPQVNLFKCGYKKHKEQSITANEN